MPLTLSRPLDVSAVLSQPLHEGWTFLHGEDAREYSAQVPGCIHTDLRRHDLIPDPFWGSNERELDWIEERDWTYTLRFHADEEVLQKAHIELVCESLDTLATLSLNGQEIARTENMFIGYRFDVKSQLRAGENELQIHFASTRPYLEARRAAHPGDEWNDPVGGSSNIRKEPCAFGWDWGPRLVSCGIAAPIRLEAFGENRIARVHVSQHHEAGKVRVSLRPTLASTRENARYLVQLKLGEETIVETDELDFDVPDAQLWWPSGMGVQPLYDLRVTLQGDAENALDAWQKRIGFRTVLLDRHADEWGESFQFVVNGKPMFAKGANWIPAHAFITEATRETYDGLLLSATQANMNMLRVWGGGIYESEHFYDICDERGLLVWQDFMFACGTYPGDEKFLESVRREAEYQVARLQERACLALWCGNNEIEEGFVKTILSTPEKRRAYEGIFHEILPRAVEEFDGVTAYWPSSPHHPDGLENTKPDHNTAGDTHFWDVWHARAPVKNYEKTNFRFCSEFGMQSYSSPEVAAQFCDESEMNVFSPAMENHQKNPAGNQIILDYLSRQYRFPHDYSSLAYLSQLNQAETLRIGIEHFRRGMPRTMGALYWQLNDCWPVFSWSSLEFDGRWKALHYEARRFFAPALLSLFVPGDETAGIANRMKSTIRDVHFFTVFDGPQDTRGTLHWELRHLDARVLASGTREVELHYGESKEHFAMDFLDSMTEHGAGNIYLRAWLEIEGETVSRQTAFFTARRFLNLPRGPIESEIEAAGSREYSLTFRSKVFQHRVQFHLANTRYHADDNFFDLFPDEPRAVRVHLEEDASREEIAARLTAMSLRDSF